MRVVILITLLALTACAGGSLGGKGLGQSSEPTNDRERIEYKQALLRCYKTGGTRVVKITGKLQCY